mgnify:CR=1 FL=1
MTMDTNRLLGIHAGSLSLHGKRLELLSQNIANVETPGYKAKSIDFAAAMRALEAQAASGSESRAGMSPNADISATMQPVLRTQTQPSLDGNSVDLGREQAEFAEAALRYRASLGFVESRLRGMLTAITGE